MIVNVDVNANVRGSNDRVFGEIGFTDKSEKFPRRSARKLSGGSRGAAAP